MVGARLLRPHDDPVDEVGERRRAYGKPADATEHAERVIFYVVADLLARRAVVPRPQARHRALTDPRDATARVLDVFIINEPRRLRHGRRRFRGRHGVVRRSRFRHHGFLARAPPRSSPPLVP